MRDKKHQKPKSKTHKTPKEGNKGSELKKHKIRDKYKANI